MKKRIAGGIVALLFAVGITVTNYTGEDVTLPNGDVIKTKELAQHLTKKYRDRSVEDLYITIHHTAGPKTQTIENIARYHVDENGWPEIAYHIAIDENGDVFFLNDIEQLTYHDSGENTKSIGVVLVGNYENYQPSDEMVESVRIVTDALCQSIKIKGIRGHRDTSATLCPGTFAYKEVKYMFF